MILSLSNQAYIFFISIIIGLIIGFLYDFFRLLRKVVNHKNTTVYIEDTIFWLLSTFISFYILLHKNNLEFRFYLLLGIFLGLIFYFLCISYFVMTLTIKLIKLILKPIAFILKILYPHFRTVNNMRNKAIYKEKIYLQKISRYGKMGYRNFKSNIKIIKDKI